MAEKHDRDENRPLLTDAEFAIALADLTTQGLVEWFGDEELRMTDKGIDRGLEMKDKLGDTDWVLLTLFYERIRDVTSDTS